jgi:hypothetical protein
VTRRPVVDTSFFFCFFPWKDGDEFFWWGNSNKGGLLMDLPVNLWWKKQHLIFLIFVCRCGNHTQSQNNGRGGPRQSTNGSLKPSNCMGELGSALKVNFCIYHTLSNCKPFPNSSICACWSFIRKCLIIISSGLPIWSYYVVNMNLFVLFSYSPFCLLYRACWDKDGCANQKPCSKILHQGSFSIFLASAHVWLFPYFSRCFVFSRL